MTSNSARLESLTYSGFFGMTHILDEGITGRTALIFNSDEQKKI
jgi:hypothetical protein